MKVLQGANHNLVAVASDLINYLKTHRMDPDNTILGTSPCSFPVRSGGIITGKIIRNSAQLQKFIRNNFSFAEGPPQGSR